MKHRGMLTLLACMLLATALAGLAFAEAAFAADGHITGTASDGFNGLAGIKVVPCTGQPGDAQWEERWDLAADTLGDGSYDLPVPPGTYRLRFVDLSGTYGYQFWPTAIIAGAATDIEVVDGQTASDKNVILPLAARIEGTVTADEGGALLENISVVASAEFDGMWPGVLGAQTLSDGTYEIDGLPPGVFAITFVDDATWLYAMESYDDVPSYRGDLTYKFIVSEGAHFENIDAGLALASSIEGTVTGSGTELAGAQVWLAQYVGENGWSWMDMQETEPDGSYAFRGLQAGDYRLQFESPDGLWAAECWENKAAFVNYADTLTLAVGEKRTEVSADLEPAGFISGVVSGEGTGPLEGAWVTANVAQGEWLETVAWAQTDPVGVYTLRGLAEGAYIVEFNAGGDWQREYYDGGDGTLDWTAALGVGVTAGDTQVGIDALLSPGAHITGTVTDGTDPIENIRVATYVWRDEGDGNGWWEERGEWQAWTNASGYYDLGGLPAGEYRIGFYDDSNNVWATEFWDDKHAANLADTIALDPGETESDKDAVLETAGTISGRVTSNGTDGVGGITVAAGVFDLGSDLYEHIAWAQTDPDGYYTLQGLPADSYKVQFWDESGNWLSTHYLNAQDWHDADVLELDVGEDLTEVDVQLEPAAHITGTVTDGTDPIESIRVAVYTWFDEGDGNGWWEERGEWQAWTNASGYYDLGGLPAGDYRIGFYDDAGPVPTWATEFWDDAKAASFADTITLDPGETESDKDAVLAAARSIGGRVTSNGTDGIGGITVAAGVFDLGSDIYEHIAWAQTDPGGYYTLQGLPAGVYKVQFWDDAGNWLSEYYHDDADWHDADVLDLEADTQLADIDEVLAPAGHIKGTISLERPSDGYTGVGVNAYLLVDMGGWTDWQHVTGSEPQPDGSYDLGGLPAGDYALEFYDNRGIYAQEYYDDSVSMDGAEPVTVAAGASVEDTDVLLDLAGGIAGTVTADGVPVQGISVWPHYWDEAAQAWINVGGYGGTTDQNGHYSIPIKEGIYRVLIVDWPAYTYAHQWWDGGTGAPADFLGEDIVVVKEQISDDRDAALTDASHITAYVEDDVGDPLNGITVELLYDTGAEGWQVIATGQTIAGAWTSEALLPGDYTVHFVDEVGLLGEAWYLDGKSDGATTVALGEGVDYDLLPQALPLPGNSEPVAVDDAYSAAKNMTLSVPAPGVLANDSDEDEDDDLTIVQVGNPGNGTVTVNANGSFTYAPDTDFTGTDFFTYRLYDGYSYSGESTVWITVKNTNAAPVAVADTGYAVPEDMALQAGISPVVPSVLANDSDADGDQLFAVKVSNPGHGTVTLWPDGGFLYRPDTNFHGTDSFTYKASDGSADSNTVTVTITVTSVNDGPPVAVADGPYTATEDAQLSVAAATGVLANDTDVDLDPLQAVKVTDPAHGALTLNNDGSFTYTPTSNYAGPDSFTYKANDGTADSNTVTVLLAVTAANDAPVAQADGPYTTAEDTPLSVMVGAGVLANDSDPDPGALLTAVKVTDPAHGVLALAGNGSFTYTPNADYNGPDSFTYKANDGTADSNVVTVSLNVTPVDDAPTATALVLSGPVAPFAYNTAPILKATLSTPSGPAGAGKLVIFERYVSGAWMPLGGVSTDANGVATFMGPALKSASRFRAEFMGVTGLAASTSAEVVVAPKAWLTTPAAPSAVGRNRAFSASGYLKPRHTAGTYPVKLQCYRYEKQRNGTWKWILRKTVSARASNYSSYTRYSARIALGSRGRWKIRARHLDASHALTYSGWKYVTVR